MKNKNNGVKINIILWLFYFFVLFGFKNSGMEKHTDERLPYGIVIHGGAGVILKENMLPGKELMIKKSLQEVIDTCYEMLSNGYSALDVVTKAVVMLEDNPLFNAGKGSVLNSDGKVEMDASIMDGSNKMAGSVAGVRYVKNPVLLAKEVMLHSNHVMLIGRGAEKFAKERGMKMMPEKYFHTPEREKHWKDAHTRGEIRLDHSNPQKFGTVGAVALDKQGNLAAATSTGGMTNKKYGRVGDSPVIGAGTYAENGVCAISCTGHGEFFIRNVVAYDITALIKYKNMTLEQAAKEVILHKLVDQKGDGGVIGIDPEGNLVAVFNTPGMYRAAKNSRQSWVKIYKD